MFMKANILTLITISTAIFLASCEKEIEFKGEEIDPKLVVNSLVEVGQPVKANISKSCFFLSSNTVMTAPDDLVATLNVNGNRIGEMTPFFDTIWESLDMNDYYLISSYCNEYCPQQGDIVSITASANGFDDVEGTTSPLPKPVDCAVTDCKIIDWNVNYSENYEGESDSICYVYYTLELTVEITDPNPRQTDFFRLYVENGSWYVEGFNYVSCYAQYNDPVFGATVADDYDVINFNDLDLGPENVFTDMLFDGKSYSIKIPVYGSLKMDGTAPPDFFSIELEVEHLSKEYYNYLNTCNQGDEIMQFFAEPIQTYSNVSGGYGLVGGKAVSTLRFPLPLEE